MTDIGTDPACCVTCKRALDETALALGTAHWYATAREQTRQVVRLQAEVARLEAELHRYVKPCVDLTHVDLVEQVERLTKETQRVYAQRDVAEVAQAKAEAERDEARAEMTEVVTAVDDALRGASVAILIKHYERVKAELRDALDGRQRDRDEEADLAEERRARAEAAWDVVGRERDKALAEVERLKRAGADPAETMRLRAALDRVETAASEAWKLLGSVVMR